MNINENRLYNQLLDDELTDKLFNLVADDIEKLSGSIIENDPTMGKK